MEDLFEFVGDILEFVSDVSEGVTESNSVSKCTKYIITTVIFFILIFLCIIFAIGFDTSVEKITCCVLAVLLLLFYFYSLIKISRS